MPRLARVEDKSLTDSIRAAQLPVTTTGIVLGTCTRKLGTFFLMLYLRKGGFIFNHSFASHFLSVVENK